MLKYLALVLLITSCNNKSDLEMLKGTWRSVNGDDRNLKLIVNDTAFIYRNPGHDDIYHFEFTDSDRQLILIDPNGSRHKFYLRGISDDRMEWDTEDNYTVRWAR